MLPINKNVRKITWNRLNCFVHGSTGSIDGGFNGQVELGIPGTRHELCVLFVRVPGLPQARFASFWIRELLCIGIRSLVALEKVCQGCGSTGSTVGPTKLMHETTVKTGTVAIVLCGVAGERAVAGIDVVEGKVGKDDFGRGRLESVQRVGHHVGGLVAKLSGGVTKPSDVDWVCNCCWCKEKQ